MANFIKGTEKMVGETAFSAHVNDASVHVTADEKASWNYAAESAMYTTNEDGQKYLSDSYMESFFASVLASNPGTETKKYGIQWCAWPDQSTSTTAAVNLPWAADEMIDGENYIKKLGDNAGLVGDFRSEGISPSSNRDDYENLPAFMWWHVNFIRDKHGNPLPVAIEGMSSYKTSGDADVGTMTMKLYVKYVETTDSTVAPSQFPSGCPVRQIWLSVSPPSGETGWAPVSECVRHDGAVAPYAIRATYTSVIASDGMWRSQPGLRPLCGASGTSYSYSSFIDGYRNKGEGWQGGSIEIYTWGWLMCMMKYGAKSTSNLSNGVWAYNKNNVRDINGLLVQEAVTVGADTFAITAEDATKIAPGCILTLVASSSSAASNVSSSLNNAVYSSSGYTSNSKGISCATVVSIAPRNNGSGLVDVKLDATSTQASAAKAVQFCPGKTITGMSDGVMGHRDGTIGNSQSGWNPWRIAGIEFGYGLVEIPLDAVTCAVNFNPDSCSNDGIALWMAPKGMTRVTGDSNTPNSEIESVYVNAGLCAYTAERTFDLTNGLTNFGDSSNPKYVAATFRPTAGLTNNPDYSYDKAYGDYAYVYGYSYPCIVWLGSGGGPSDYDAGNVGLLYFDTSGDLGHSHSGFASRC